jgi:hypothetical protein
MLDTLRKPFFIIAAVAMVMVVLIELSSIGRLGAAAGDQTSMAVPTPGKGIGSLALLDGLVLYTTILIGLALIVPERIQGRLQGVATLVFSVLLLLAEIALIPAVLILLVLMVTLLLSPIFGTIAYFAIYGHFDTVGAKTALGLIMTLKLLFASCLVLAHQRFLQNKGYLFLIITSLVGTFAIGFLHSLVPGFLVSITDDIGAILVSIAAAIWTIVFLVGSIVSVVKAVT